MSGDEWIALVGVSSGAIVGIGGLVFAYFNGTAERVHAERLARSGRLHEQRRLAYTEVARQLERQRLFLERTQTLLPTPPPPAPLDDDEWTALNGLAAISTSPEVEAALRETVQTVSVFQGAVSLYRHEEENPRAAKAAHRRGKSAYFEMEQARDRAAAAIIEAERVMREELATL